MNPQFWRIQKDTCEELPVQHKSLAREILIWEHQESQSQIAAIFLLQTSLSPAKPQWGSFFLKTSQKESQSRLRLFVVRKSWGFSWGEGHFGGPQKSLRFFHLRQKIAIAEKFDTWCTQILIFSGMGTTPTLKKKMLSERQGHSWSNSRNSGPFSEQLSELPSRPKPQGKHNLSVLSHHLKCEMKSPHLVDLSWDLVDFWVEFELNLGHLLADFSRD